MNEMAPKLTPEYVTSAVKELERRMTKACEDMDYITMLDIVHLNGGLNPKNEFIRQHIAMGLSVTEAKALAEEVFHE